MPRLAGSIGLLLCLAFVPAAEGALKVPSALAWGPSGKLAVALRDGRAIAWVEPGTWRLESEWPLPIRPISLDLADDGRTLFVGGADGEALAIRDGQVVCRFESGLGPTRVLALPGGRAVVASRWDEIARVVDGRDGRTLARHPLGSPAGALVRTPNGRVVVADAFAGRVTEFEPGREGSERSVRWPGVNLHGLAISGDGRELLAVHMAQEAASAINRTNIDWGLVISSKLAAMRLGDFEANGRAPIVHRLTLDGSGNGAADPSALAVTPDGRKVLIASAGAHRVLLVDRTLGPQANPDVLSLGDAQRIKEVVVGRSPAALVLDPSGTLAITADAMADTLTVVAVDGLKVVATVPLGSESPEPTAEQRGEAWFRDGRAAHDRWMSCASCHADGHTSGLNFDTNGDDTYGAPKNVPTLLGSADTAPYAWTGRFETMEAQLHESLETSLRGPGARPGQVEDLTAFLRTLEPPPPKRCGDDPAAQRGAESFRARGCDACHAPPTYTRPVVKDVGLDDGPGGHRRFNPPSLRGVSRTAPYFHDGRAKTLDDVLKAHNPGSDGLVPESERADLAAFLESL